MAEQTVTAPGPELLDTDTGSAGEWLVIVFNNDVNTWDEVVGILQKATGCSLQEAEMETWEIDNQGKSIVHYGGKPECDRAAAVISTIGIKVSVDQL